MVAVFFDIGSTLVDRNFNWIDGARMCVATLRGAGVPLGLISNTGILARDELRVLLPADFNFDQFEPDLVVLSSEFGSEKPNPAIFRHAVAQSGRIPADCVFVGEDLRETWAAQFVGMRCVRVHQFPLDFNILAELGAGP